MQLPLWSAVTVRVNPVLTFLIVMTAPGSTAPLGSRTDPFSC
jgi:hypothetical protein